MRDEEKIIIGLMLIAIPVIYIQTRGTPEQVVGGDQPPKPPPPEKPVQTKEGEDPMSDSPPIYQPPTHSRDPTQGFRPQAPSHETVQYRINQQRQALSIRFYQEVSDEFASWQHRKSDYLRRRGDAKLDFLRIQSKLGKELVILPEELREQLVHLKDQSRDLGNDLTGLFPKVKQFIGQLQSVRGEDVTANTFRTVLTQLTKEVGEMKQNSDYISDVLDKDHIARIKKTEYKPSNPSVPQIQVPQPSVDFSKLEKYFSQQQQTMKDLTAATMTKLDKAVQEMKAQNAFTQSAVNPLPLTTAKLLGEQGITKEDLDDIEKNVRTPAYVKPDGTSHRGSNSSFDTAASNQPSTTQAQVNRGIDIANEKNQRTTGKRSAEQGPTVIGNPDEDEEEAPAKIFNDPFDQGGGGAKKPTPGGPDTDPILNPFAELRPVSRQPVNTANFEQARPPLRNKERDYADIEYSKVLENNEWTSIMNGFLRNLSRPDIKPGERNFQYAQLITTDPSTITYITGNDWEEITLPQNISNTIPDAIFYNMLSPRNKKFLDVNDKLHELATLHSMSTDDFIQQRVRISPEFKKYFNTVNTVRDRLHADGHNLTWVGEALSSYGRTALYRAQKLRASGEFEKLADITHEAPEQIYNAWQREGDRRFTQATRLV